MRYIDCEECNGTGEIMIAKLYSSGHTEITGPCPYCYGEGVIELKELNYEIF